MCVSINTQQAGLTAADVEIGDWLRKHYSKKCIILAVNKCESPRKGFMQASDFWSLGYIGSFYVSLQIFVASVKLESS